MNDYDDEVYQLTLSELVTPSMANFEGNLHGGNLLSLADKAAYVCAKRYSKEYCVTASMDQVSFISPVLIGELIIFYARVVYVGKTSMNVEINVVAENLATGDTRQVSTCFATMVAIRNGRPAVVPMLKCKDEEQKRNFIKAHLRRELVKEHANKVNDINNKVDNMTSNEVDRQVEHINNVVRS